MFTCLQLPDVCVHKLSPASMVRRRARPIGGQWRRRDFETTNPLPMRGGMTIDIYIPKGILQ